MLWASAIRAQSGVPGSKSTYGVSKDQKYDQPNAACLPKRWSTEKYLAITRLSQAGKMSGDDLHLLHDVHHRLTPIECGKER